MKYIVIDEPADGHSGDQFETVCLTAEEANKNARIAWGYLTARERKTRHIYAGRIPEESSWIDPDLYDNSDIDDFPGAFDSSKI